MKREIDTAKVVVRDSNFELLRLVSMSFIILYHLISFFAAPRYPNNSFWFAIQYPLHIGVILFVLISGYYGIRTKAKGIVHILLLTFVYFTPLTVAEYLFRSCFEIIG